MRLQGRPERRAPGSRTVAIREPPSRGKLRSACARPVDRHRIRFVGHGKRQEHRLPTGHWPGGPKHPEFAMAPGLGPPMGGGAFQPEVCSSGAAGRGRRLRRSPTSSPTNDPDLIAFAEQTLRASSATAGLESISELRPSPARVLPNPRVQAAWNRHAVDQGQKASSQSRSCRGPPQGSAITTAAREAPPARRAGRRSQATLSGACAGNSGFTPPSSVPQSAKGGGIRANHMKSGGHGAAVNPPFLKIQRLRNRSECLALAPQVS